MSVPVKIYRSVTYQEGFTPSNPNVTGDPVINPINPSGGPAEELVPYDGALRDVNLGEKGISTGFLTLDTTPTNTPTTQGTFYWDEDDNTVDIILNGYIMKVGEDLFYPVKNQTGSSIPKGTNVRFAGTVGGSGRLLIEPYLADGTYATSRYMGVTAEAIGNGEDGKVLWFGRIRGINTNAYNEGDVLYASTSSAGGFQTTLPVAPNNIVEVCAVVTKSVNNGVIFVRPQFLSVADSNKVSYNLADSKNATERNQARVNIGSTSATPQVIATAGAINDLVVSSNSLVFTGALVILSGIVAGLDGEEIAILNASGTNLELLSQSALSTASNRFASGVIVPNLSIVRLKYRTTTARWVLENVGINDGRYVSKVNNDDKTGNLRFLNASSLPIVRITLNGSEFANVFETLQIDGTVSFALNRQGQISQNSVAGGSSSVPVSLSFFSILFFRFRNNLPESGETNLISAEFSNRAVFLRSANSLQRSQSSNGFTIRDELYLNYSQTVATAGTINNLAINTDCKLLILTGADDLTGVVFVDNTRLLRIEARGGARIIRDQSALSTNVNRFTLGADLTINDGEVYQFIYTNSRWRRVL
jgi:hypothetical protein